MKKNLTRHNSIYAVTVCILVTLSLGCLCLPTGITPTIAPTPIPPVVVTEPPVPTVPPVSFPPINSGMLNDEGPWLLMETEQGLWAANPDGSGLTQLTDVNYWHWGLAQAVQPGGNLIVFRTPAAFGFHHMALYLLSLPDGSITKLTDLTSPETEAYADLAMGDDGMEAMRAVHQTPNYAWSLDGTRLAFVGLMDGPTAEIYLYDAVSEEIQRVSTDDAQNYWPAWSPDGNTLLYFGTQGFGSGAGFDTTGVWYAKGDGSDASFLFDPEGGPEEMVGWLDDSTVVLDSWNMHCGSAMLHLFDLESKQATMLTEDCITGAAIPTWGYAAMFADSSGLYLLTAEDRTPERVSEELVTGIDSMGPSDRLFTVRFENGNIATYGTGQSEFDYQVSPIESGSGWLDVAEYGVIWGWTSEDNSEVGAWITGPGIEIGKIFEYNARLPIWDGHNNLLFFARYADTYGYNIYRTTFDAYYQDLEMVGFLDGNIMAVAWLGGE